jgi:mannose-6-phosphate isomerase
MRSRTSWACTKKAVSMSDPPAVRRAEESIVEKPWGYEVRWAITDRYLGKILHVRKGEALSLQYHERKDEWLLLVRGVVDAELGVEDGELKTVRMSEGDTVHLAPGTRHRITAVEDADIYEVSTPEIDDVVRIEDRYGRVSG